MTNAVVILSLKGTLVFGLEQALFSICEEGGSGFTNFLHKDPTHLSDLSQATPHFSLPNQGYGPHWPASSVNTEDRRLRIPLRKKSRDSRRSDVVMYTSAIPQILLSNDSFFQSLTLPEVSQLVTDRLQKVMFDLVDCELDHKGCDISLVSKLWHELKIETHRSGWMGFRLSQVGIGLWLTHCLRQYDIGIVLHKKQHLMHLSCQKHGPLSEALMWQVQYAHARCCSLLRRWHHAWPHDDTTAAVELGSHSDVERLINWPWLASCSEGGCEQANLVHSLIEVTDHMFWIPYQWRSKQYFLLLDCVILMCQGIERFCAVCLSGFPAVAQSGAIASIQKKQAQFYLIRLAQKTLETFLISCLGAEAPKQL